MKRQQNITALRCFFHVVFQHHHPDDNPYDWISMLMLANVSHLKAYYEKLQDQDWTPKTLLNRIEGLKLALKWIICFAEMLAEEEKTYADPISPFTLRNGAEAAVNYLTQICASLRPSSKEQEKNILTIQQAKERGRYLEEAEMAIGIEKLRNFVYSDLFINKSVTVKNFIRFQTIFIFAFFTTLPTQRRQVLADLNVENIIENEEMNVIIFKFVKEKNAYFQRNLSRCFSVIGIAYEVLAELLKIRAALFPALKTCGPFLLTAKGEKMQKEAITRKFTTFSLKFFGLTLNLLDMRHIRCTHFVRSVRVDATLSVNEKEEAIDRYATNIGNTKAMLLSHYVYLDNVDLAEGSAELSHQANNYYDQLMPSALMERPKPFVEIIVKKEKIEPMNSID